MKNRNLARALAALAATGIAAGCAQVPQTREYINPRTAADQGATPLSSAVRVGDTLYLSGSLGLNADRQVPDDPAEETRNIMNSIQRNVEAAGMTMDDIVYVQIFCSDVSHYQAFNDVYRTYFTREYPARAFLGSGRLLFDARFEVQAIAVKR